MLITYEQAKEADSRGEKVEVSWPDKPKNFYPLGTHPVWSNLRNCYFRLADPYAHLKAAHKAGKVIQLNDGYSPWVDWPNPDWSATPSAYRIKPDELKIEAGKFYRNVNHPTIKLRCLCTDAPGLSPYVFLSPNGQLPRYNQHDVQCLTPWTDTPAPYDNWDKVPAWANWQAMTEFGFWCFYEKEPKRNQSIWDFVERGSGSLPKRFYPTNFDGPWEESLQERPK